LPGLPPEKKKFKVPWHITLLIIVGCILGVGAIFNQLGLISDAAEYDMPGEIPKEGGGVHIYVTGNKTDANQPSVLLLGGWGTAGPVADYMPLINMIKDGVRVIAVERPGYGYADNTFSERTLDNMVDEMRSGLDELGEFAPYVIVAHTTAGLEAIHYAALYPNEVDGIVFINALSPGAYYYQPYKFLDYVKVFTYPVPKYTGIFRTIGLFNKEMFATGPYVDPYWYAAQYFKNVMSGGMRAELFMLSKNAHTALLHGDLEVDSAAFVDSRQFNESNPELVRVWGDYFSNIIQTDVGPYIHGFETSMVAQEIMRLVGIGTLKERHTEEPEPESEPEPEPEFSPEVFQLMQDLGIEEIHRLLISHGLFLELTDTTEQNEEIWYAVTPQISTVYEIGVLDFNVPVSVYDSSLNPLASESDGYLLAEGNMYFLHIEYEDEESSRQLLISAKRNHISNNWSHQGSLTAEMPGYGLVFTVENEGEHYFDFNYDSEEISIVVWEMSAGVRQIHIDIDGYSVLASGTVYLIEVNSLISELESLSYNMRIDYVSE
jgi:pimeloyl-ACP methyl ester carboxylesterase